MKGIMSTRTFLLKSTRLMTSHQANLSKSALSDIQLRGPRSKTLPCPNVHDQPSHPLASGHSGRCY